MRNSKTILHDNDGNRYRPTADLPKVLKNEDDIFVEVGVTDRLDTLANQFYGNTKFWWIIALANNLGKGTLYIPAGTILRIPPNPNSINTKANTTNTGY